MNDITITTEEWLAELERLHSEQPDGFTRAEFQAAMGVCRDKAQSMIRQGIAAGLLRYAGRRRVTDVTGRLMGVPVYCQVKNGGGDDDREANG